MASLMYPGRRASNLSLAVFLAFRGSGPTDAQRQGSPSVVTPAAWHVDHPFAARTAPSFVFAAAESSRSPRWPYKASRAGCSEPQQEDSMR